MPNQKYAFKKIENASIEMKPALKKSINKGGFLIAGLCLLIALIYTFYLGFLAISVNDLNTPISSWAINILITLVFYNLAYRCYKTAKANQRLMTNPYLPISEQSKLLPRPLTIILKSVGTLFFLMLVIAGIALKDWLLFASCLSLTVGIYITYLQAKFPKIDLINLYLKSIVFLGILAILIRKIH